MIAVYFDLETAGIRDDQPDIQLAAVAVQETTWQELDSIEMKLKFDESLADPEALKINHYDPQVWAKQAVSESEAVQHFANFLNAHRSLQMISKRTGNPYTVARLVGHNAATFDGPRIQRMFARHRAFLPADPRTRCTMQAAMNWFDSHEIQPPSYRLTDLCRWFRLPVLDDAHDALADVRMTINLSLRLRDNRTPEQIIADSGGSIAEREMMGATV